MLLSGQGCGDPSLRSFYPVRTFSTWACLATFRILEGSWHRAQRTVCAATGAPGWCRGWGACLEPGMAGSRSPSPSPGPWHHHSRNPLVNRLFCCWLMTLVNGYQSLETSRKTSPLGMDSPGTRCFLCDSRGLGICSKTWPETQPLLGSTCAFWTKSWLPHVPSAGLKVAGLGVPDVSINS